MKKEINIYQKLRYLVNLYWEKIGIKDLYIFWKKFMHLKSSKDLKESRVIKFISRYEKWIQQAESGEMDIPEEKILIMEIFDIPEKFIIK